MPSTNFLQFNPNESNQESDSAYNADSSRAGGLAVNSIVPSALLNKVLYQASTMITALATYLVGQGQNASDTNLATLTSAIQAALAAQIFNAVAVIAVAFSSTPTFDASQGVNFEMTLTGNVTSSSFINAKPGQRISFIIHQDATGGRTFVWPTNVFGTGTVDPGASNTSVQEFIIETDLSLRPLTAMTVS